MFESHIETCNGPALTGRGSDEQRFSILRFFQQSAFLNHQLLCYWPTIHNLISKICPRFQVLSSHFSEVDEPIETPSCSMSIEQQWFEAKIFQLQSMSNTIACIDIMFAVKNSGISCLALIFNLSIEQSENDIPARKKSVQACETWRVIYCF